MIAYRVTTHDLRPPVQGGPPIWDGATPHDLPVVEVDTSDRDCAAGWNACATPEQAIRIAGEWPDGRPSRLWVCSSSAEHPPLVRGDRFRAASWRVEREAAEAEAYEARLRLYAPMAGGDLRVEEIVAEVEAWRAALARPRRDEAAVEAGLRAALEARGLGGWTLRRYPDARTTWAARATWAAWYTWAVWDTWAVLDIWDIWDTWDTWDAWDARDAWDTWDAWAALIVHVSARRGWAPNRPDLLTVGLRDAYASGLAVAVPTGPRELGWAMEAP